MDLETNKPDSPETWMAYLEMKLNRESARSEMYVQYYDGQESSLRFAQDKFAEIFGNLGFGWQDNFCRLIVDSISERLNISGFRFGDEEGNDEDAQKIWQRNCLDADSNAAHIDSLVRGHSYLVVWGDEDGEPIISPEPASQVTVQYLAGSRRKLEAGLKRYYDDWGVEYCTLWLPDEVYTATKVDGGWVVNFDNSGANQLGEVPIVPLSNRSRLITAGRSLTDRDDEHGGFASLSELANIVRIQDAINKVSFDAIVASEFAAFPQRIITGLEFDSEEEEKEEVLKAYVNRIITPAGDGEQVKWGQFEAADLSNYVKLIDMLVQHMASQSRVPFNYFLLSGARAPSGDAVTAAEAGLVAKVRERMLHFGEAWECAMRMAFKIKEDPRSEAWDAQTVWDDPEFRSQGALTDALLKQKELGVPMVVLQKRAGYSDKEIARFKDLRAQELDEEVSKQKKLAPVTGAEGGSASAGNGTKASQPKNASVERQNAKAKAA